MGLYGGNTVLYQQPNIPKDDTFAQYLKYQQTREDAAQQKVDAAEKVQKAEKEARKAAGSAAYSPFKQSLTSQLRQGLVGFPEATQQLRDYASKYDIAPPEQDIQDLTTEYTTNILPQRRQAAISAAYQDVMGRAPTEQELTQEKERFTQGIYGTNQDLRDKLAKDPRVAKKLNDNYLDNYYDILYGKQSTFTKDDVGQVEGGLTGKRTFKFDKTLLPTYQGDVSQETGVNLPSFGDITGTPAEIEQQLSNIRDTRQFLYSSGLTRLQGAIDKQTQQLKNEGAKDVAKIGLQSNLYSGLVSGFWG